MRKFSKRALVCFVMLCMLFTLCGARVFNVAMTEEYSLAATEQSTRLKKVGEIRGTVYDVNGRPLTNTESREITVILPTEKGVIAAAGLLEGEQLENALQTLRGGNPVVLTDVKAQGEPEGTLTVTVPVRYSGTLSHIIGYVDGTGHGVYGIEKGFDDILYTQNGIGISYSVDSGGRMISGFDWKIQTDYSKGSVVLTVDSILERIAEQALGDGVGAVVITDAKNGEIRAMASSPSFSANDISASLEDENSPFVNRALSAYNVGSSFKPVVAAAAIENGMQYYKYTCTGSITVDGKEFRCNKSAGHGEMDMESALSQSCNTYFYTLAVALGGDSIYNILDSFRFDSQLDLSGGIIAESGNLPSKLSLKNSDAALCNLAIGQGELMINPVALSQVYAAIVNGGKYYMPKIVKSYQINGRTVEGDSLPATVAMSEGTAEILKSYLKTALKSGTGSTAYVEGVEAGGKTATAQTGWKDGDRDILNGWFCGFYEGGETYVITVVREDVQSGSNDCAPIFKEIITAMKNNGF